MESISNITSESMEQNQEGIAQINATISPAPNLLFDGISSGDSVEAKANIV
jgi:hypothetical protein